MSLLPVVTVVALGLLVPAFVTALLLARGRHASASIGGDRRGRVAVATAVVAATGGSAGITLGAGPPAAAAASLLLAAPVLVWALLAPWWPLRAVVAWAMLVAGSVGLVAMATAHALESSLPWASLPVAALGSAVVVLVLGRVNGPFRRVLGIRAGLHRAVRTPLFLRPAMLRPALTLSVFLAAMAVGGLTGVAPGPREGNAPEAGPGGTPGTSEGRDAVDGSDVRPMSAETTTPSESARGEGSASPSNVAPAATRAGPDTPDPRASARHTRTSTPGSGSPTADGSTGTGQDASDQSTPRVASTPAGDPDPAGVPQDDPVEKVRETTQDVTDSAEPVPTPVRDTVDETLEPAQAVVEDTTEEVLDPVRDTVRPVQGVVEDTTEVVLDPISSLP